MVNYKRGQGSFVKILCVSVSLILSSNALAQATENSVSKSEQTSVLGKKAGAKLESSVSASNQLGTSISVKILGAAIQVLMALSSPPNTIGGTTYTEVFSFGRRVFQSSSSLKVDGGSLVYNVGLAPTEVRVPAVVYPVGPLLLQVDGGARFKASANASISETIGVPASLSAINGHLGAVASAAGFVEGYAKFLVIRAGLGGQVDLIEANANIDARMSFDGSDPVVTISAMAHFLKGRFYAFVDYFSVFPWKWKRLLDYDLYSWNGFCFSTGAISCPVKQP